MDEILVGDDRYVCELAHDTPPACTVPQGGVVRLRCREACDRDTGPGPDRAGAPNPSTGPIAVAGAEPGTCLRVDILEIVPAGVGHIGDERGGYREIRIARGLADFGAGRCVRLRPMIGCIGVAPASGSWDTTTCGLVPSARVGRAARALVGGNMDTNDVAPGASLYLPVFVPGGRLVAGDVHAVMGDGELGGQGVEVAAELVLRVGVESAPVSMSAYVRRDGWLATLGAGETLDDACRMAALLMIDVVARATGASLYDAEKLLGSIGEVRVGQLCCPVKTARVCVPEASLDARVHTAHHPSGGDDRASGRNVRRRRPGKRGGER